LIRVRERITREARILQGFDHPNIVKLYDVYEHDGKIAIVMEFVERGDLLSFIGPEGSPENEVRAVFLQIVNALQYCHQHQVYKNESFEHIRLN
jgi:carbon catabolite-derepressing protein kinase